MLMPPSHSMNMAFAVFWVKNSLWIKGYLNYFCKLKVAHALAVDSMETSYTL